MRISRATILPVLAMAALASCSARSGSAAPVSIEAVNALVEKAGLDRPTSTLMANDFTLETPDGKKVSLSSYKGQVVLLSFWATWCGPCKEEMPEMQTLYDNLKSRGLTVVAVDVMEDKDTVNRFLKENHYSFPVLLDSNGATAGSGMYAVSAIPTNYVLDRSGRIVGRAVGIGGPTWMSNERVSLFEALLKQ